MMQEPNAEQYAHLPEHPTDPFLRIIGVALARPRQPGQKCPWGLAFHVVFPESPRPKRIVRVRILSQNGSLAEQLPDVVYPQGPCIAHEPLFNSRVMIDREHGDVYDVHKLPDGTYRAEAKLLDANGHVCWQDALAFDVGPLPRLKHRFKLVYDFEKEHPDWQKNWKVAGAVVLGDIDGDGEVEYVHYVGARHMAAYRASGELLWRYDDPEGVMGAGACAWDFNGDGKAEIVCARGPFRNVRLSILEGATGQVINEIECPVINTSGVMPEMEGKPASEWERWSWKTGRAIRIIDGTPNIAVGVAPANFRGLHEARDMMVSIGDQNCVTMVAMTEDLEVLWQFHCANGRAGHVSRLMDTDGDGRDELIIGTQLVDHDGTVLWEKPFESFAAPWEDDHIDAADADDIDGDGNVEIAYSSRMVVEARTGKRRWIDPTWHGQDVWIGKIREDLPGKQILFNDREYRHFMRSKGFIHGTLTDVRDAEGNKLWERRFMSMHNSQMLDWLPNGLRQVCAASDLQRFAPNPNLQIFDGRGVLVDVLPSVAPYNLTRDRKTGTIRCQVPRGLLVQQPFMTLPHRDIYVYECGK